MYSRLRFFCQDQSNLQQIRNVEMCKLLTYCTWWRHQLLLNLQMIYSFLTNVMYRISRAAVLRLQGHKIVMFVFLAVLISISTHLKSVLSEENEPKFLLIQLEVPGRKKYSDFLRKICFWSVSPLDNSNSNQVSSFFRSESAAQNVQFPPICESEFWFFHKNFPQ